MKTQLNLGMPSWHSNPHVGGTACPGHTVFQPKELKLLLGPSCAFRLGTRALSLWLLGLRLLLSLITGRGFSILSLLALVVVLLRIPARIKIHEDRDDVDQQIDWDYVDQ